MCLYASLPKPMESTVSRVKLSVNCGRWVMMSVSVGSALVTNAPSGEWCPLQGRLSVTGGGGRRENLCFRLGLPVRT